MATHSARSQSPGARPPTSLSINNQFYGGFEKGTNRPPFKTVDRPHSFSRQHSGKAMGGDQSPRHRSPSMSGIMGFNNNSDGTPAGTPQPRNGGTPMASNGEPHFSRRYPRSSKYQAARSLVELTQGAEGANGGGSGSSPSATAAPLPGKRHVSPVVVRSPSADGVVHGKHHAPPPAASKEATGLMTSGPRAQSPSTVGRGVVKFTDHRNMRDHFHSIVDNVGPNAAVNGGSQQTAAPLPFSGGKKTWTMKNAESASSTTMDLPKAHKRFVSPQRRSLEGVLTPLPIRAPSPYKVVAPFATD